jgi:hypothetical protein
MIHWIRKSARIMCFLAFFAVFFLDLDYADPFSPLQGSLALLKGITAAVAVWLLFYIISDMAFKGMLEDIEPKEDDVLDEGLMQHINQERDRSKIEAGTSGK